MDNRVLTVNYPICVVSLFSAEPLKKKKRIDPALLMARETKKRRRIEKQLRRLEKLGRKLKPVDEIRGDYKLRRQME